MEINTKTILFLFYLINLIITTHRGVKKEPLSVYPMFTIVFLIQMYMVELRELLS